MKKKGIKLTITLEDDNTIKTNLDRNGNCMEHIGFIQAGVKVLLREERIMMDAVGKGVGK